MKRRVLAALMALGVMTLAVGCGSDSTKVERDYDITKCVTLGEYKALAKEVKEVTEADIDALIEEALEAAGTAEEITEGIVKEGDTVNIDYVGKKDDIAFEGGTAKGYDLGIGSGQFIPGFEEGLVGVGVGDTVDLNLTFPENYHSEELAGQEVVFTVTVNYIHGDIVKPSVEDYAASNDFESVEAFRVEVENELKEENAANAENNIWATAVSNATINEYPQSEMDKAFTNMKEYYSQVAAAYGTDLNTLLTQLGSSEETFEDDMTDYAQSAVAEKLVAMAIAEAEGITVSDEEYNAKIDEYLATYTQYETKEEIEAIIDPNNLREQLLMEKVMQFVKDSAQ